MAKYHVNSSGNPGLCSASAAACPFGGANEHYTSAEAARAAFEERMKDTTFAAKNSVPESERTYSRRCPKCGSNSGVKMRTIVASVGAGVSEEQHMNCSKCLEQFPLQELEGPERMIQRRADQQKALDHEASNVRIKMLKARDAFNAASDQLDKTALWEGMSDYTKEGKARAAAEARYERAKATLKKAEAAQDSIRYLSVPGEEEIGFDGRNRVPAGLVGKKLENGHNSYQFPTGSSYVEELEPYGYLVTDGKKSKAVAEFEKAIKSAERQNQREWAQKSAQS